MDRYYPLSCQVAIATRALTSSILPCSPHKPLQVGTTYSRRSVQDLRTCVDRCRHVRGHSLCQCMIQYCSFTSVDEGTARATTAAARLFLLALGGHSPHEIRKPYTAFSNQN